MSAVAIYCRISQDEDGLEKGVQRQLEDARALAAARGWDVAQEYVDNDTSAFNGAVRDAYRQLMEDAETGEFDRIVCYMTSRLWRSRMERAQAVTRLGKLRIGIAAVKGPDLDLSTASGRVLADLLGSFDTLESETMSERLQREELQRAQEGRPHSALGYGWRRIYQTDSSGRITGSRDEEHPDQAPVVREIIDRLLTGETLRALVRELNDRGLPAPRGGEWKPTILRQVVLRPANAAIRVYKGSEMGVGVWPPLVERDVYHRLVALLTAPERRTERPGKRRHLLTFGQIGACGVCSGPLSARLERGVHWVYRCNSAGSHVSRSMRAVDELVGAVVVERLSRPDAAGIFDGDDSEAAAARSRADAIRARLDTAADEYSAGNIDAQQLARITATLRPQLDAASQDIRRARPLALPRDVDELQGAKAAATWEELTVTAKRAVVQAIGLSVKIVPRSKSEPGFNPDDVIFSWDSA